MKDLGIQVPSRTAKTDQLGSITADAESEGPASYAVSHMVRVQSSTTMDVVREVATTLNPQTNEVTKEFTGVGFSLTTTTTSSSGEQLAATGTATATVNGKDYSTTMATKESPGLQFSDPNKTVTSGYFKVAAVDVNPKMSIPTIKVTGNFLRVSGEGATPVVYHGLYLRPISYTHNFPQFDQK
ncbi:MAG: hypothetical protein EOO09_14820 [Chitinophagaceae bacterium]|nr:MAG: hypothetical protein EOO09_14820 [Chitinophagaceae bacterium]